MSSAHDAPPAPGPPEPLSPVVPAPRRSPAEEARTLVAATRQAALGTLTEDGAPWASLVTFAVLGDGSLVLWLSTLAEHGRNLVADPRASLMIADPTPRADPLATGRVTLAGRAEPAGDDAELARAAYVERMGAWSDYSGWKDFTLYVLRVERIRWVGGYGRMDSASAVDYAAATADPVATAAAGAVTHLNDDHADALLLIAQALGGFPDATGACCTALDRYALELAVDTPRGRTDTRVAWVEPLTAPGALRPASVALVAAARARGVRPL